MSAVFPILTAFVVAAIFSAWFFFAGPGLIALTYSVFEFCKGIFVSCVENYYILKLVLIWPGAALLSAGFVYAIVKSLRGFLSATRAIRLLPLKYPNKDVVLIDAPGVFAAFTHGFLMPRIYISKGLIERLDSAELKAVFLHELYHKKRLHPLKFFLLNFIRDAFFYIPVLRGITRFVLLKKENEADLNAIAATGAPLSLASALVKASKAGAVLPPALASITGGRPCGIEERIKNILNQDKISLPSLSARALAVSISASLLIVIALAMPLSAAITGSKDGNPSCTNKHCSLHVDRLGKVCRTHCRAHEHAGHRS
ncbi:MAG: M56 family metallopeptidase [Deltaproteobacteria bacterium]|nr:M56 family metallopeptidase [Deltaproteobacteria bacterium]